MSDNRRCVKTLFDPMKHPEWIAPHSEAWYAQLGDETGIYEYPWRSQFDSQTAEAVFASKLAEYAKGGMVLEVGCGHGKFASDMASVAYEVVGIDISNAFIAAANDRYGSSHVRFLAIDGDGALPFDDHRFDLAFTKKGPKGWFREANRVVRPGGKVAALYHAGSHGLIREIFPGLYHPLSYPQPNDLLSEMGLEHSGLVDIAVELIEETEYLLSAEDVLLKKCFGQNRRLREIVWEKCLRDVESIFNEHATSKGLKVTNCYYLLTAAASFGDRREG